MAGFVNEYVREMIARKTCRHQPENKGLCVYLYILRLSVYTILDNIVPILLIDFTWRISPINIVLRITEPFPILTPK